MAQIPYRANLSSAIFPMTVGQAGRTVINPGFDQNFDRRVDPTGSQTDVGIPQAMYLENVLPTSSGYQSVGFASLDGTISVTVGYSLIKAMTLKAEAPVVGPPAITGLILDVPFFIATDGAGSYQFLSGPLGDKTVVFVGAAPTLFITRISNAVLVGVSYVLIGTQLYTAITDFTGILTLTNITATVTPLGFFAASAIVSITASNNYLLANNNATVFYSSLTTPTDFVASLISGAGEISPNDTDNALVWINAAERGFYCFTNTNVLYGQYTGNARYPWKFSVVLGTTGITGGFNFDRQQLSGDVSTVGHFTIEYNNEIRLLQGASASQVAPEVSNYLSRETYRDVFNSATNTFSKVEISTQLPGIYYFLNRYVLVSCDGGPSYGSATTQYQSVIVYDIALRRYGRFKIQHTSIIVIDPIWAQFVPQKENIAFVDTNTKKIYYLSLDIYTGETYPAGITAQPHAAVFILGKVQFVRNRLLTIEELEIEGLQDSSIVNPPNFSVRLLPSLDGRTFDPAVTPYQVSVSGELGKYSLHNTAINHSIVCKGAFNLSTLQMRFTVRGDR